MELAITQLENNDTIETGIRFTENMTVLGVRLRLYKHGLPDGTLTITLKDGASSLGNMELTMVNLNADVGIYFHGYVLFETEASGLNIRLDPTSTYKELSIEVTLSYHTNDDANYIGLIKNSTYEQSVTSYGVISNESDMSEEQLLHFQPYGLEIYSI